ncbi:unnamed protein product [Rotaria sp. Silwood2]|nr:unnamed protein product [Rotaria sp. Silwood2]
MAVNETEEQFKYRTLRFSDIAKESHEVLMPISGCENIPLVSLEESIEPLVSLLPSIGIYANLAKQKYDKSDDCLSLDESAAIMLYSMNWKPIDECLYVALNAALRSKDRGNLIPWYLFLKLFLTALYKLPSIPRQIVYGGCRFDLRTYYKKEETIVWWGFSTCTTSKETLEMEKILGTTDLRTIFTIDCYSGKDIRKYSYNPLENYRLLLGGIQFKVVDCTDNDSGLHMIHLKEIQSPFALLDRPSSDFSQKDSIQRGSTSTSRDQVVRARAFEDIPVGESTPPNSTKVNRPK